jgi:hypothetical protein
VSDGEIHSDEVLYRRLSPNSNPARFDSNQQPRVHQADFLPGPMDTDGLSVIRAKFREAHMAAFSQAFPDKRYLLAELCASDLLKLGLTIKCLPDELDQQSEGTPAHAVLVELNTSEYKGQGKVAIKQLAMTISQKYVHRIIGPFDPPNNNL